MRAKADVHQRRDGGALPLQALLVQTDSEAVKVETNPEMPCYCTFCGWHFSAKVSFEHPRMDGHTLVQPGGFAVCGQCALELVRRLVREIETRRLPVRGLPIR